MWGATGGRGRRGREARTKLGKVGQALGHGCTWGLRGKRMVGRHPIAVLANLAVLNRGVLGRGRGRTIGVIVDSHVVDALVDAAHLELIEAFLEELHVAATVADLGVEPRADGIVVRLGPHIVGGGHEDALLFDLALDVEDGLIFVHGGRGRAMRSRKTVEMLQGPEGREGEEGGGDVCEAAWSSHSGQCLCWRGQNEQRSVRLSTGRQRALKDEGLTKYYARKKKEKQRGASQWREETTEDEGRRRGEEEGRFYQQRRPSLGVSLSLSLSRSGSNTREVDADWVQTEEEGWWWWKVGSGKDVVSDRGGEGTEGLCLGWAVFGGHYSSAVCWTGTGVCCWAVVLWRGFSVLMSWPAGPTVSPLSPSSPVFTARELGMGCGRGG